MMQAIKKRFAGVATALRDSDYPPRHVMARNESLVLGVLAGTYVQRGLPEDYITIKAAIRDAIRNDSFDGAAFNEGYVRVTHRDYDYDEQQGDLFEIGRETDDKAFRDARERAPQRPVTWFGSAMRLIR